MRAKTFLIAAAAAILLAGCADGTEDADENTLECNIPAELQGTTWVYTSTVSDIQSMKFVFGETDFSAYIDGTETDSMANAGGSFSDTWGTSADGTSINYAYGIDGENDVFGDYAWIFLYNTENYYQLTFYPDAYDQSTVYILFRT